MRITNDVSLAVFVRNRDIMSERTFSAAAVYSEIESENSKSRLKTFLEDDVFEKTRSRPNGILSETKNV